MTILSLDPGPVESAYLELHGDIVGLAGKRSNAEVLDIVRTLARQPGNRTDGPFFVVEMMSSYGKPIGREVMETLVWLGRFVEAWEGNRVHGNAPHALLKRREVKQHLCGTVDVGDPEVRAALIRRFTPRGADASCAIGTKRQPGPLHGVTGDVWAALAVAVTFADRRRGSARIVESVVKPDGQGLSGEVARVRG